MSPANLPILRPALADDIPFIIALERRPDARNFVGQWSEDRHLRTMTGDDARYFVSVLEPSEIGAYAILRGIGEPSRSIEFKRLVVATPGKGLGRRIVKELMKIAFEDHHAHRLFLDVYDDNVRARRLYESLGFVYEGIMREAGERDDQFISLHLMSMLDREYRANVSQATQVSPPL